jgi:gluconate 5-dehydrogenase
MVTGGSRGLGLEIAGGLGNAGAAVAITARREDALQRAVGTLIDRGIDALAVPCDVSAEEQVIAAVERVMSRYGRIDVLVNNAGISWGEAVDTMASDKFRHVLDTNATGCFLMSRAVARMMIRAGHGGSIVNVASITALVGTPANVLDAVGYAASKGAILSLTRDLAVKWAPHGIRVNAVAPGFFDTKLSSGVLRRSQTQIEQAAPMGRIGRPGELEGVVLFFAAPAAEYITGQVLAVDGGTTAW